MVKKIFDYIIAHSQATSKKSVIDFFSKKDKVFTKKIPVTGNKIILNGLRVRYVSLTSVSGNFDDVSVNDIRVNMTNWMGMWVNVFIDSLPNHYIEQIAKQIGA